MTERSVPPSLDTVARTSTTRGRGRFRGRSANRRPPLPKGFGTIWTTVALDLVGFGIVLPVLPLYARRYHASAATAGALVAAFSLAQLLASPVWGRVSDRVGRKPVLIVSLAGTALGSLCTGLAAGLPLLFIGRLVDGASGASVSVAQASVADLARPDQRARLFGLLGAAFGLGFVLGPALGGALSGVSLSAPGWAAAALAAANGVAAFFVLPEPADHVAAGRRARLPALLDELGRPGIGRLIVIYFLAIVAFSGMEATFALLAEHRYGLDQRHVSYVFAFIGVVVTIVQGGLIGRLTRRFGERALLVAGLAFQALGLVALPYGQGIGAALLAVAPHGLAEAHALSAGVAGLLAASLPLAVGSGLTGPAMASLLSRGARAEDQGGTLGIGQAAAALGRIAGPISATNAYDHVGVGAPYVAGAAILLLTAAIGTTLRRPVGAGGAPAGTPVPRET